MEWRTLNKSKNFLILLGVISVMLIYVFFNACGSDDDDDSDSSDEIELEEEPQFCSKKHNNYIACTRNCKEKGRCLGQCVDEWYGEFLECCSDYNADINCRLNCFSVSLGCFDNCEDGDQDTHEECYHNFTDCLEGCPVPVYED